MIPKFFGPLFSIAIFWYRCDGRWDRKVLKASWMTDGGTGAIPPVAEGEGSTRFCSADFK